MGNAREADAFTPPKYLIFAQLTTWQLNLDFWDVEDAW